MRRLKFSTFITDDTIYKDNKYNKVSFNVVMPDTKKKKEIVGKV